MKSKIIPYGNYCYTIIGEECGRIKIIQCPYWGMSKRRPYQLNGYCLLTGDCDWLENIQGLLWDQVKTCGIKEEYYEE